MSQQSFEYCCEELKNSIETCYKNQLLTPSLILIYSGIDIMAWLNRFETHDDVDRSDFIWWVEKYLLPDSGLSCSAIDLYGARCSLLHSYTSESRLSRKGGAKSIYYTWGTKSPDDLQNLMKERLKPISVIKIEQLFKAFCTSLDRFKQDLLNDSDRAKLVYDRGEKFLQLMKYKGDQLIM
jgi:hypothetical protein